MVGRTVGVMALVVFLLSVWFGAQARRALVPGTNKESSSAVLVEPGRELVVVYLGAAACSISNKPEVPQIVAAVQERWAQAALAAGLRMTSIGVAVDHDSATGLKHLSKFAHFDLVMAGGGNLNLGWRRYVVEEIPGTAATPQLVVTERLVGNTHEVLSERLIARKVGLKAMSHLVDDTANLTVGKK